MVSTPLLIAGLVEDYPQIRTRHLDKPRSKLGERVRVWSGDDPVHLTCHDDPARVIIEDRWGKPHGEVLLHAQDCHYGGVRPWFLCPGCGKRRLALILRAGAAKCRRCHGLNYRSSRMRTWERHEEERERLEEWLADPPKGTWQRRYERVLERYREIGGMGW